ncbi:MAG: NAD(P)H-dependent oxidoreductase subunit E [Planctomycetaceae bacterium]|nr:MAG: NAD(P)H-dependent oxidoreductase subunit E [Planctomycetaceae bacterium]RPI83857.1 MAG: NAD(P)H-dependent oxidoreductase subunit E [Planctomycetaceae bacterium]
MPTTTPQPVLTPQMRAEIEAYFPRYPTKQAVTLPALHIINEHLRCVPQGAIPELAQLLELSPAQVYDTLSFYGFFKSSPCGKVRAWVCRSISCALRGGEEVLETLSAKLGVAPGETTSDGKITLEFGECLGLCDFAPAMLANETVYKNLTVETAADVAAQLKKQAES